MGFYSCLKVHCILKDEYIEVIKRLYQTYYVVKHNKHGVNVWLEVNKQFNLPFINEWMIGRKRTCMIPFGGPVSLLHKWKKEGLYGNQWKFTCEFKNYDNEINSFISRVLLKICKKIIYCEYIDEDEENGMIFYENYEVPQC